MDSDGTISVLLFTTSGNTNGNWKDILFNACSRDDYLVWFKVNFFLSFYKAQSLFVCLSLSLSVSLSLSLSVSLSVSLSLTVSPSLSLFLYLYLSGSLYLSLNLFLFAFLSVYLYSNFSFYQSVYESRFLCLSEFICPSVSLSIDT